MTAWDNKKEPNINHKGNVNRNNNLSVSDRSRPNTVMLEDIDVATKISSKGNEILEKVSKMEFYLREWREEKREKVREKEVVDQWRKIAVIWDKFFFWLFLGVLAFVTPVVFGIIPLFKPHPDLTVIPHKSG